MTINVTLYAILQASLPTIIELSIAGVAWSICFRSSIRRQSRGLFLVSLGFFAMLIVDGSLAVIDWFILGGPFEFLVFAPTGVSFDQFAQIASLTGWILSAAYSVSFALLAVFVIRGALRLMNEKRMASNTTL